MKLKTCPVDVLLLPSYITIAPAFWDLKVPTNILTECCKKWPLEPETFVKIKFFFLISLLDVCMKDSMSVADSLYNLQFIREFCDSCLKSCCHLALEDMLYTPQELQVLSVWITDEQKNIFTQILCYLLSAWFIFWDLDELAELPGRTA